MHKFDGQFHQKWKIMNILDNSFTGVSRSEFEDYIKKLEASGFVGEPVITTLDGCNVLVYDAANTEKEVYISIFFNEQLQSLDIMFTNDGTNFS